MPETLTKVSTEKEWEDLLGLSTELALKAPFFSGEGQFGLEIGTNLDIYLPKKNRLSLDLSFGSTSMGEDGGGEWSKSFYTKIMWARTIAEGWKVKVGPLFSYESSTEIEIEEGDDEASDGGLTMKRSEDRRIGTGLSLIFQLDVTRFQSDLKYINQADPGDPHLLDFKIKGRQGFNAMTFPSASSFFKDMHIEEIGLGLDYRLTQYICSETSRHRIHGDGEIKWAIFDGWSLSTGISIDADLTKGKKVIAPFIEITHTIPGWIFSFTLFFGDAYDTSDY